MTRNLTIALDCMGGDRAPQIVIEGADIVASKDQKVRFLFCGNEKKITPIVNNCRYLKGRFEIIHTKDLVSSDEKPSIALRKGKNSSMRLAIDAVKENRADCVVSAGNTGALMAMSKIVFRPLDNIDRPAIIGLIPTKTGKPTVMLDMGANVEADSNILFQFCVMGKAFATAVLKTKKPKIAILNVGSEDVKGHEGVQNIAALLRESELKNNFYGFVEGDDLMTGKVDVIVTDGFTGNIALKAIEGAAKLVASKVKEALNANIFAMIGAIFAGLSIKKHTKSLDPRFSNGAMLIGLNGITVKSHGSTDNIGFANAIEVSISLVKDQINEKIAKELKDLDKVIKNNKQNNLK